MKNRIYCYIGVLFVLLLVLWFVYISVRFPFIGAYAEPNGYKQWEITRIDSEGMAGNAGLKIGDVVTHLNGEDINEIARFLRTREVEQADTITILRDGVAHNLMVHNNGTDMVLLISSSGALISIVIAFLLFWKMPEMRSVQYLSYVFLIIGLIYSGLGASSRGDVLGKAVVGCLIMIVPIVFYYFLFHFMKEKGDITLPFGFIKYLYAFIIGEAIFRFVIYKFGSPDISFPVYEGNTKIIILFFITGVLFNLFLLLYTYIKYNKKNAYLSILLKTMWFSLLISFAPFCILSFIPQLIYGHEWVSSFYTSWFVLLFPLSFAYLIAAKRLYDIDIILKRLLFMTVLAIGPSILLIVMFFLLSGNEETIGRLSLVFIFTVILISFVLYSLEYITTKLEALIFPRKHVLQMALKKIAKSLGAIQSFREMRDIVLVDIVHTLQVAGGAIVIKYIDDVETVIEGTIDKDAVEHAVVEGAIQSSLYTWFEVNKHEEYTSYLVMTNKKTNTMLNKEEIQWLQLIISYLSVSMENLYLINKLNLRLHELATQMPEENESEYFTWIRKSLFDLQEKERTRIATDLHDITMQDIFFVGRKMQSLHQEVSSQEGKKQLTEVLNHLELINSNLRQCCFELNPSLIKTIGLVNTIRNLIEMEKDNVNFVFNFVTDGSGRIETMAMDTKRHLFRIVQELFNNAKKHSQAKEVTLKISAGNNDLYLWYEDNGKGFEYEPKDFDPSEKSGMGLGQLRSRVSFMNGHMDLKTAMGQGLKVHIRIPLAEGMTA